MLEFMRCAIIAIVIIVIVGCSARLDKRSDNANEHNYTAKEDPTMALIISELKEAPAWTKITNDESALKLMDAISAIASHDIDSIRQAIMQFSSDASRDESRYVDETSKIYVLNRYIFAVPNNVIDNNIQFFGGWGVPPHDGRFSNLLWPLSEMEGGLKLVGRFRGYFGAEYTPIQEFDYFHKTYGLRKKSGS